MKTEAKLREHLTAEPPGLPGPGVYENVPDREYHSWPYCSQSRLWKMHVTSPGHMREEMENPTDPTEDQILGWAIHDAVLLPELFEERYTVAGQCEARKKDRERCTNPGKVCHDGHWYCLTKGHDPGGIPDVLDVLSEKNHEISLNVRSSVMSKTAAEVLLRGERKELSIVFDDEETGVRCKARIDCFNEIMGAAPDLKSTRDASKPGFMRAIAKYGYYIQAPFYLRALYSVGLVAHFFSFIACEKKAPWGGKNVQVFNLHGEAIDGGLKVLRPLLKQWKECEESGEWPGHSDKVVDITLPPWEWKKIEEAGIEVVE